LELPLSSKDTPKGTAIVLKPSEPLLNKGYTVLMDNYYNSPALAKFLKSCKTLRGNYQSKQEGYAEETARQQAAEGRGDSAAQWTSLS
jgi:hypothetical protein